MVPQLRIAAGREDYIATVPKTPVDVRKSMTEFDPTKLLGEFQNMLKQYKLPGVDIDALVASQEKNVEAVVNANRIALEGMQAIAKRQAEVFQEAMQEASGAVSSLSKANSPQDLAATQTELMTTAFEKSVATMRELAEIVAKSSQEATVSINARISSSLDELRAFAGPHSAPGGRPPIEKTTEGRW